ncbi:cell division protein ZapD [Serratia sp. UGAL515B_01]|uniref:cell division protein ZapD n=1 Tax=Serratia sp. UGAL515B_01 TaxID=2986763 RepID=UPI002952B9D0|nr:cell division protein ZapD [Serratia sp. UGAL515B_01]WON77698.1 cell division protein ZapD [Serratia sp. UGAL515B_01]
MSDASPTVLFEHPLNEKMRTWLRIEFLLQQLHGQRALNETAIALTFFRTVADLLDVLERGEVRTELLKELERQQQKLLQWAEMPGVDMALIEQLRSQLKACTTSLMSAPRMGQALREDRLIGLVRQRLSIPGGCCSFDLPTLHMWMHVSQHERDTDVAAWLKTLEPLNQALTMVLALVRQAGQFRNQISLNGFFQDNAEGADLLRLNINLDYQVYPQISGHKTRYAIRFMPIDSENSKVPERLTFELACC